MCYDEGALQAYLDRELPGRKRWEIEAHIETCGECRARLIELEDANKLAISSITALSQDVYIDRFATEKAWSRLVRDGRFGVPSDTKGVLGMVNSKWKTILIPVAAAAVIATSFAFTPVREATASFLTIFRVEKVQPVNITAKDLNDIQREMRKLDHLKGGKADIKNFGKVETDAKSDRPHEATLDEAQKAADFKLGFPAQVAGYGAPKYQVADGSTTSLTLDVNKANELIKYFGGKELLPTSLNGKKFTVKRYAMIMAEYPKANAKPVGIVQSRNPELILPDGVDPAQVREVLLSLPILPDNIRRQLEQIKDWTHTLPVPNIGGSTETQNVKVNGIDGVFMKVSKDPNGKALDIGGLVWQKDRIYTAIGGEKMDLNTALAIAASMK